MSTLRLNGPRVAVSEVAVRSGDDSSFHLAKFVGEKWQDECLSQFTRPEYTQIRSRSQKRGESLSQEKAVISVRDKKLIVQRAQKGDPEALNLLLESCRGQLFACALRILPRRQDAEDAVQEAMLAASTHLKEFHGRADFLKWATSIVINVALMQIRRARSRPVISWD